MKTEIVIASEYNEENGIMVVDFTFTNKYGQKYVRGFDVTKEQMTKPENIKWAIEMSVKALTEMIMDDLVQEISQ